MNANRIRIVVYGDLGCAQIELIGLVVEVVEVIYLTVGGIARTVGVIAVVAVEVPLKSIDPRLQTDAAAGAGV